MRTLASLGHRPRALEGASISLLAPTNGRWMCSRSPIAGASSPRACFLLADDLAYRPPGDPELVFVVMMCSYATDIARGLLPGPFDDVDARRYARAALIP